MLEASSALSGVCKGWTLTTFTLTLLYLQKQTKFFLTLGFSFTVAGSKGDWALPEYFGGSFFPWACHIRGLCWEGLDAHKWRVGD